MDAVAFKQTEVFEAARIFAQTEGFVVAPETAHCVKAVIDEAIRCRERNEEKVIFFANSGHGHFDMAAYEAFLRGKLKDYEYPEEKIRESLAKLPKVPMS